MPLKKPVGTVTLDADGWVLSGEPHVLMRLKSVFTQVAKSYAEKLHLSDTPDIARDIDWFMSRYEMKIAPKHKRHLAEQVNRFEERQTLVEKFRSGILEPRRFELAEPARDYQVDVAEFFLQRHSLLLGDDMGIGKTVTAICALVQPETRPALVVAPKPLQRQWVKQLNRFAPGLNVHLLKARSTYDLMGLGVFPDVIVSTYAKLLGWADVLKGTVRTVVFDEIQDLRHGTSTNKGEAAKYIANAAVYRLGMSATPINNLGAEFWHVFQFLFPGALGTWSEFLIEWCGAVDARGRSKLRDPKAFGDYIRTTGMMIRRTRADVKRELPALTRIAHTIDSDEEPLRKVENAAMRLARIIVERSAAPKDEMRIRGEFSYMMRHATGVAKAPYVAEFVKLLLESEKKVLLFGWHYDVYAIWRARLEKDHEVRMFVGETTDAQRVKAEKDFMEGDAQVLIMSLRAAAGLDGLQHVCRTVVFGELDHSPGVHEQDICRIYRDGQPDPVAAYFLLAEDGSDPVLADMLQIKRAQIEGVRNPSLDIIESLEADDSRIRRMAEEFLKKDKRQRRRKSA